MQDADTNQLRRRDNRSSSSDRQCLVSQLRRHYTYTPESSQGIQKRFRMPHPSFLDLCASVREDPLFGQWINRRDAAGRLSSPIELLVLGSLRYLGRGLTLIDLKDTTGISPEVLSRFHPFWALFPRLFDSSILSDDVDKYNSF
jgi:hypothetical protein